MDYLSIYDRIIVISFVEKHYESIVITGASMCCTIVRFHLIGHRLFLDVWQSLVKPRWRLTITTAGTTTVRYNLHSTDLMPAFPARTATYYGLLATFAIYLTQKLSSRTEAKIRNSENFPTITALSYLTLLLPSFLLYCTDPLLVLISLFFSSLKFCSPAAACL